MVKIENRCGKKSSLKVNIWKYHVKNDNQIITLSLFSQLYAKVLPIKCFQLGQMAQKYYLTLAISGWFMFEIGKVN